MATGKIHSAVTLGATAGLGVGYLLSQLLIADPIVIAAGMLGAVTGVLVGPDLDVDDGNISNYYIRKVFLVDWFWSIFWRPYRLSLKHRSIWSHWPVISTIIRILYSFLPFTILLFKDQGTSLITLIPNILISQIMSIPLLALFIFYPDLFMQYGLVFFIGLLLSDILHYLFDR